MTSVTYSSTKAQIWNAYKALLKTPKQAERPVERAPKAAPVAASVEVPSDIAGVIAGLSQLQVGFRESVSGLQEGLVREAARLGALRGESAGLRARLAREHGIEVSDESLAALIEDDGRRIEAADEAHAARVDAHERAIAALRAEWAAETARHRAAVVERDGDRKVALAREAAEYRYAIEHRRAADADGWQQATRLREKALAGFEAETRSAWSARHEALEVRETELRTLEAKAEAFPGELAAGVERARAQGLGIARKQAQTEAKLRAKAFEGRQRLGAERIEALESTIATQRAQLDRLGNQLESALEQAQQLAVKALEGAANATSFAAVREIAIEQARNAKNGK
jgi:hypothetical protein